jgi:hypothetical protein
MKARHLLGLVILLHGGLHTAFDQGWLRIPPAYNPWAPLDIQASTNPFTRIKLWRLQADADYCAASLATSALSYRELRGNPGSADCPLERAVRVQRGEGVRLSGSFLASCPLAVSFALFERQALQPAAEAVYGQRVAEVEHYGSFACRNIYGRASGRRSQHATANALDIAGLRMADGRRISVARDWKGDPKAQRFLRLVRDGACRAFNTTLGPDYNAAHRDHFHVDMGGFRVCR